MKEFLRLCFGAFFMCLGVAIVFWPLSWFLHDEPLKPGTCTYTVTSEGYDGKNFTLTLTSAKPDSECGEMLVKIDENYFKDINYTLEGGH